jgi:hypothetical protein
MALLSERVGVGDEDSVAVNKRSGPILVESIGPASSAGCVRRAQSHIGIPIQAVAVQPERVADLFSALEGAVLFTSETKQPLALPLTSLP